MSKEKYMWMALDLAKKSRGRTSPNPLVGAVVVKEGEVVGTGSHKEAGGPHAEVFALEEAGENAYGATLYVNLEPCSHYGRTPPCVEKIISTGIKKVVASHLDPNPKVAGKGFDILRKSGVSVTTGILEKEARKLNEAFIKHITTGLPFVTLKAATTLDGKIATKTGASRWITGEKSREAVHRLRDMSDAILTGIGTVIADDPQLTTRLQKGGRDPIRIVVDSRARISLDAKILNLNSAAPTIVAVTEKANSENIKKLEEKGAEVLVTPEKDGQVNLKNLLSELGRREIQNLVVEGGGTLGYSLLEQGLVDKIYCFIAPLIFGGERAPSFIGGDGITSVSDAWSLEDLEIKNYDKDLLLVGYVKGGKNSCSQV